MVASCIIDGGPCNYERDFVPFETPEFGNCYTFNSKHNPGEDDDFPRTATLTGASNG